jgi:hypothetical protein
MLIPGGPMFGDSMFFSPFLIPIVAIIGGITVAIVNSINRSRIRELEIRERIAMIERGMVPSPEADPNGFERRMHAVERVQYRHAGSKYRAGGIMVMSVGFGLMALIGFAGAPREAVGVGGFLVIIGLGLLINSLFATPQPPMPPPPPAPPSSLS